MENSNTNGEISPYEKPLVTPQRREQPEPQVVVGPSVVGPAELLMLLVFVVELVTMPSCTPSPTTYGAVAIGCCLSLPAMLAVWSSIRLGWWRYSLVVLLSLLNGILLTWCASPDFELLLLLLPLASALPVLITLLVIKLLFGRFAPLATDSSQFIEGLRFNLSHLLTVTTVLAILLAVGKFFWPMRSVVLEHPGVLMIVVYISALISFNTLMFVWALMGKQMVLRICIAIPVGLVTSLICIKVCNVGGDEFIWCIVLGLPLVSSLLLMAVFRFSGWRFVRETTS